MTRTLAAGFSSALRDKVLYQAYLVDLDIDGDPVYVWTGPGQLTWGAKTYLGAGELGSLGQMRETIDGSAAGITFTLSGVDPDLLNDAMAADYQGREWRIYMALYDQDVLQVSDPQLIASGELDTMVVQDGEAAIITVTGETYQTLDQRVNEVRYTPEAQDKLYPGDKGFEFLEAVQDANLLWGTKGNDALSTGNVGGGRFGGGGWFS